MIEGQVPAAVVRGVTTTLRHLCQRIGPRPGGSVQEAQARRWLKEQFCRLGLRVRPEERFDFVDSDYSACRGEWRAGGRRGLLDLRPCSYSPSTPPGGIAGELVLLGPAARRHRPDTRLCGKVGLLLGMPMPDPNFLTTLCRRGLAAAIFLDHRANSQWPVTLNFPEAWASLVEIPLFSLPYAQGWRLAQCQRVQVRLSARCACFRSRSANIIAELPGRSTEVMVFCAHLDSVRGSAGAADDASGIAAMLEIARLLSGRRPLRRTLRFVGMGMEERLSVGAAHHVQHACSGRLALVFNFDSCGSLLGADEVHVAGWPALRSFVRRACERQGFPAQVHPTITPYVDAFPFNVAGVASLWFYRPSLTSGDWFFHSANDSCENVSAEAIARTAIFAAHLAAELAEMPRWPFPRGLPPRQLQQVRRYQEFMYGPARAILVVTGRRARR